MSGKYRKFGTNYKILPIHSCCYSVVGNPLVCAIGKETNCPGMTLMPMSMNLNSTEGKFLPYNVTSLSHML